MSEVLHIRDLQKIEVEMLKVVLSILEEEQIPYFALGGTLLGAVRHGGFIPWDDDIDIGIPREGYERFLEVAPERLPEHLELKYFRNQKDEERLVYAAQVINRDFQIVERIAKEPIETFLWVDVFPLDGMPNRFFLRKFHEFHLLYLRFRIQLSMFEHNVHLYRHDRPLFERMLIALFSKWKVGRNSDTRSLMEKMDKALQKYSYEESNWLINFMGAWKLKEVFPKSVYGDGEDYPFEDIRIRGPKNADAVLRQLYGDYMTPPQGKTVYHALEMAGDGNT